MTKQEALQQTLSGYWAMDCDSEIPNDWYFTEKIADPKNHFVFHQHIIDDCNNDNVSFEEFDKKYLQIETK